MTVERIIELLSEVEDQTLQVYGQVHVSVRLPDELDVCDVNYDSYRQCVFIDLQK